MPLILPFIPVIQNTSLPAATVGVPYAATITSVSGVQPVTYAITSDSPNTGNWLSINPTTGVLSGTPTTAETESVTIVATDALNQLSAPANFTLTVHPTVTFNFFMSPTGVDTNPGTLSQPWSLLAFHSKRAQYAGKSIGLIGDQGSFQYANASGTPVSLYSLIQGVTGSGPNVALTVQGNAGTSTYIASCDSNGNPIARIAVLDFRNPTTGVYPGGNLSNGGIGQSDANTSNQPTVWGGVTIDAITVRGFAYAGICFRAITGQMANPLIIKNCEVYDNIGGLTVGIGNALSSANNPAAIHLTNTGPGGTASPAGASCTVINNKVHDVYTDPNVSYNGWGYNGIGFLKWHGQIICNNNSSYNNGCPISVKDTTLGYGSIDHNYCEMGQFGLHSNDGQGYFGAIAFTQPGFQRPNLDITNNICIGFLAAKSAGSGTSNFGNGRIENNTFYMPEPGGSATGFALFSGVWQAGVEQNPPGTWTWLGNIVYWAAGNYSQFTKGSVVFDTYAQGTTGVTAATADYNWYGNNGNGCKFSVGNSSNMTFATYKSLTGYDSHSTYSGTPFVQIPQAQNVASFAVNAQAAIAGPNGGPVGATGTIGCNF